MVAVRIDDDIDGRLDIFAMGNTTRQDVRWPMPCPPPALPLPCSCALSLVCRSEWRLSSKSSTSVVRLSWQQGALPSLSYLTPRPLPSAQMLTTCAVRS